MTVSVDTQGSSPLARGLRPKYLRAGHDDGIIPARAGFTAGREECESYDQDHPRSRGVYNQNVITVLIGTGSSPLARGLLPQRVCTRFYPGIIPARAGFTPPPRRASGRCPDHPRSRGVYET